MKGSQLKSIVLIVCLLVLCCISCNGQIPYEDEDQAQLKKVAERLGIFSLNLILISIMNLSGINVAICPFSVWAMFAVLSEGTRERTRKELLSKFRLPNNQDILRRAFATISRQFNSKTATLQFETFNSTFVDSSKSLLTEYRKNIKQYYFTDIDQLNFADPRTVTNINKRVSDATTGKVSELVTSDDLVNAEVLLTTAGFFKGQWSIPFNKTLTKQMSFYDSHNNVIGMVNMMNQKGPFPYASLKELNVHCVKLPYGEETHLTKYYMYILLPFKNVDLPTVMKKFEQVPIGSLFRILQENIGIFEDDVDLYLPRFKITLDLTLNEILVKMGVYRIFDPTLANLSGMTRDNDTYLSRAIHRAQIEVTEEGTAGSVHTDIILSNRNTPPRFVFNKPFIYFIIEEKTNILVFGGSYVKPDF